METKSCNRDQQRTQTPANVLDVANLKAQRSLLTARIVGSRGEERRGGPWRSACARPRCWRSWRTKASAAP